MNLNPLPTKFGYEGNPDIHKIERWKFSEQDKQLIVSLWASGLTPSEVVEQAKTDYNMKLSISQVIKYSKSEKWQKLIKKIRQEVMSDLASVAGSHKKVRLQRHEKIYEKAYKVGDLRNAISATEHQRVEMEGGGDSVTMNQYNFLSDEELAEKKKEVLSRIQLIQNKGVLTIEPAS